MMLLRRIWRGRAVVLGACNRMNRVNGRDSALAFESKDLTFPSSVSSHTVLTSFSNVIQLMRPNAICFSNLACVDLPVGGIVEVPLAQTGEGIAECELLRWFVHEGDQVEEFQPLCEVQSDKATIEITSRYKGKVSQIRFLPGDIVKVGETLLNIILNETQNGPLSSAGSSSTETEALLGSTYSDTLGNKEMADRVPSTPSVRHLAKQYGLNIKDITGTGPGGRVLKEDVLRCCPTKVMPEDSMTSSEVSCIEKHDTMEKEQAMELTGEPYRDKTFSLRGFQRAMVRTMTMAAKVPHFHYMEEINCDALIELKVAFQNASSDNNVKHTYLPFLVKSLSMALEKYPILNSMFDEVSNEVTYKGYHNVGIAMATPLGLVVPNVKKVQLLSIFEITKELSRLQQLASSNKLSSDDVSGGTISLSNIGAVGGKFGNPLLNLPEVAIIAIGRIQKLPRFADDGTIYPASVALVTIGADHRVVDGATVARFCNEWKLLIENPEVLLLHMR
ncbi:hypothetical protein AMTRI_Chr02g265540 [Amborella trichopoda]|nr:lipoamide acyltransferase component of branched-chain alpha-keto acid dehydrogenase complex, mitochondrial isoform X1 [Amborella trichopoda]|eukprot:XP_011621905.1 lipoamide acyltransferase component of branched-chain alpha-keto acid dehydrogenase complex, mitochondrial isoform X1 [Amborella trichopoda]